MARCFTTERLRRALTIAAASAALVTSTAQAMAMPPNTPANIAIEPQSLATALQAFSEQSGLQVGFESQLAKGIHTDGTKGTQTPSQALDRLLQGAGLEYHFINDQTVIVTEKGARQSAAERRASDDAREVEQESSGSFRLAQVDQGQTSGTGSVESQQKLGPGASLSEVVVTAQRRTERLLDVPISIVALSSEELQARKITSLSDLQFAVPGMGVSTDGLGNKVEIRGVANDLNAASLVGVYIDEAAVTNSTGSQINPNTYDLERVEVLRGPQGTLYGEGSAGGTIRFITKNPELDRFGMTAAVASTFTQRGSPGVRADTAINIPLIDQELGLRIVGTSDREGGWIDQPAAGLKDINGEDITSVRIKALWKPSTQFTASFLAELYRNARSTGTNDDAAGNFTQVFFLTATPTVNEDHDVYNLTLSYDFPAIKLLSATTYYREQLDVHNLGYRYIFAGPPGMPPSTFDLLNPYTLTKAHAWSEELRLSSLGAGPWQWTAGGFYRHYRDFFFQPLTYYAPEGSPGDPLPAPLGLGLGDALFKSWSVFGDINYKLRERLTFGLGVRSFHEDQDRVNISDYGSGPVQTGQAAKFHSVDPRVYAQYKLSRDINIYVSAAKGFRSGGFNTNQTQPTYGPESVRTYELGTKMSLLEGRLRAELAIFNTDYKDYVVSGYTGESDLFPILSNAGNARLKGVDWDFVWRPLGQWTLAVNGNYLNARFTTLAATSTGYEIGDPLDFVPKYEVTSSAQRDLVWNSKHISMRVDYTRRGRETYTLRTIDYYRKSDVINLLGYRMNLQWSNSLSFNFFAQNLLNDHGLARPDTGAIVRSRPRTYGVGFDVSL